MSLLLSPRFSISTIFLSFGICYLGSYVALACLEQLRACLAEENHFVEELNEHEPAVSEKTKLWLTSFAHRHPYFKHLVRLYLRLHFPRYNWLWTYCRHSKWYICFSMSFVVISIWNMHFYSFAELKLEGLIEKLSFVGSLSRNKSQSISLEELKSQQLSLNFPITLDVTIIVFCLLFLFLCVCGSGYVGTYDRFFVANKADTRDFLVWKLLGKDNIKRSAVITLFDTMKSRIFGSASISPTTHHLEKLESCEDQQIPSELHSKTPKSNVAQHATVKEFNFTPEEQEKCLMILTSMPYSRILYLLATSDLQHIVLASFMVGVSVILGYLILFYSYVSFHATDGIGYTVHLNNLSADICMSLTLSIHAGYLFLAIIYLFISVTIGFWCFYRLVSLFPLREERVRFIAGVFLAAGLTGVQYLLMFHALRWNLNVVQNEDSSFRNRSLPTPSPVEYENIPVTISFD